VAAARDLLATGYALTRGRELARPDNFWGLFRSAIRELPRPGQVAGRLSPARAGALSRSHLRPPAL